MKIPNEINSLLTLVIVISHEQASAERAFNAKSICKVNLSEKSMVSKKMIIDHIPKKTTTKKQFTTIDY